MNGNSVSARLDSFPMSRFHRRLLFAAGFGWLFDAMDVGLIGFVAAALVTQWNLHPSRGWLHRVPALSGCLQEQSLPESWRTGLAASRSSRAPFSFTALQPACALWPTVSACSWGFGSWSGWALAASCLLPARS